jgi:hypothetical protein
MAIEVSKTITVKRLVDLISSIKDYTTRCKLKLANLISVKMRRDREIHRPKVQSLEMRIRRLKVSELTDSPKEKGNLVSSSLLMHVCHSVAYQFLSIQAAICSLFGRQHYYHHHFQTEIPPVSLWFSHY